MFLGETENLGNGNCSLGRNQKLGENVLRVKQKIREKTVLKIKQKIS